MVNDLAIETALQESSKGRKMKIKLEAGKEYQLLNGKICPCFEDREPGRFILNGWIYSGDGYCYNGNTVNGRRVVRCVTDDPRKWEELTDIEKGALLLAHQRGTTIEFLSNRGWVSAEDPYWGPDGAYRIKPESVVTTITRFVDSEGRVTQEKCYGCSHKLTFNYVDGEIDCKSVKLEKL